MLLVIKVYH